MQAMSKNQFIPEVKALFGLTLPILIAQLAYTSMGFVDAVMAGHFSKHDLAAIALGNSIWVPIYLLMTGVILATTPKVANLFGARNNKEIGPLVRQALWMAAMVVVVVIALLVSAHPLLLIMGASEDTAALTMKFIYGIAGGMPAIAFYQVFRCLSDGISRPRPSMVLGIIGLILNIPVNYVLVFGKLGFPAMGGAGCGIASASVMWFMFFGFLWWVSYGPAYKECEIFKRFDMPNWKAVGDLLRVGVPIGIAVFTEASIFSIIALLIAKLGDDIVAGHMIALNFSSLVFMVPLSISIAITVRVGQAVGRKEPMAAKFSAHTGILVAFLLSGVSTVLMWIFKEYVAGFYTTDKAVLLLAGHLIIFAAIYQLPDAIQVTCAGALRGYQDTGIIMLITLISYWVIAMPIGYTLGLTNYWGEPSGPAGFWISLIIGLTFASVMLGARFVYQSRNQLKKLAVASS
ncbi:MATE family efflux transporter [Entomomonas sp. E2T0]|uniref:MATE family efflux transporter n=1 Tax=Entomomonas sp. E2T0 TaxID=2930213 RepID=UPI0022282740|nr:MATE family efflux transporter [Entomomonas sp. E2T0]UYZ84337.1 MATE family efflux transporter [Entomomonas sp. E2T0]